MVPRARSAAALLAILALLAGMPAICLCPPAPGATDAEAAHGCCAPPLGVQQVQNCHGCCGGQAAITEAVPPSQPLLVAVLPLSPAPDAELAAPFVPSRAPIARPSVSPPPRVLRI